MLHPDDSRPVIAVSPCLISGMALGCLCRTTSWRPAVSEKLGESFDELVALARLACEILSRAYPSSTEIEGLARFPLLSRTVARHLSRLAPLNQVTFGCEQISEELDNAGSALQVSARPTWWRPETPEALLAGAHRSSSRRWRLTASPGPTEAERWRARTRQLTRHLAPYASYRAPAGYQWRAQ